MNDYNFGNFVCMLREKKGLTQADVAGMLGVTAAAVSKWENGSSKPRVEVLFKLAEILEVRPEELIAGHYIIEGSELSAEGDKAIKNYKPTPLGKKTVIAIVCAIIASAILFAGTIVLVVLTALDLSKDTPEYQLGYSYLIESDKFAELGLTEDDIRFNSYRRNITTNADGVKTVNVELGFRIGFGRSMYVICHDDGEGWYVCEECTKFE